MENNMERTNQRSMAKTRFSTRDLKFIELDLRSSQRGSTSTIYT